MAWNVKHAKETGHSDAWIAKNVKSDDASKDEEPEGDDEGEDEPDQEA